MHFRSKYDESEDVPQCWFTCICVFVDGHRYIFPTVFAKTSCMMNPILYGSTNATLRNEFWKLWRQMRRSLCASKVGHERDDDDPPHPRCSLVPVRLSSHFFHLAARLNIMDHLNNRLISANIGQFIGNNRLKLIPFFVWQFLFTEMARSVLDVATTFFFLKKRTHCIEYSKNKRNVHIIGV